MMGADRFWADRGQPGLTGFWAEEFDSPADNWLRATEQLCRLRADEFGQPAHNLEALNNHISGARRSG